MNKNPYERFPKIESAELTLRKIQESDLDSLFEIFSNERLFQHSPALSTQNRKTLANRIGHFERDFYKKKYILLGICLNKDSDVVVGTVEMFEYSKAVNMMTIGYRLNERYWGKGIATKAVQAMTEYLFNEIGINRIQAFVMPENVKSQNVLLRNGFVKEWLIRQGQVWKGLGQVDLVLYSLLRSDRENQASADEA